LRNIRIRRSNRGAAAATIHIDAMIDVTDTTTIASIVPRKIRYVSRILESEFNMPE